MTVQTVIDYIIPLMVFIIIVVLGLALRLYFRKLLEKTQQNNKWIHTSLFIESLWHPFIYWFVFLAAYVAVLISVLSPTVKKLSGELLASIFVISLILVTISLSEKLIRFYIGKSKLGQSLISAVIGIVRTIIIVIGILLILDIWGAPTLSIVIIISTGLVIVGLAFRNTIDNLLAGIEITYSEHVKVGQLVKIESGESGYVTQISWTRTTIRTNEGNLVIIPNFKLMTTIININNGQPLNISENNQGMAAVGLKSTLDLLSNREREVLSLIGKGATNREIAQNLIISEHTVKSHIASILNKLDVHNRQQAAVFAERAGLITETASSKTNS
jgi:small-conductance mechanosensitive channel/DNA-binding CsgD family transcriptional regulator